MSYRPLQIGDLVRMAGRPPNSFLDMGIGVITQTYVHPPELAAYGPPQPSHLVNWVKKGSQQWRGENELRRLQ